MKQDIKGLWGEYEPLFHKSRGNTLAIKDEASFKHAYDSINGKICRTNFSNSDQIRCILPDSWKYYE